MTWWTCSCLVWTQACPSRLACPYNLPTFCIRTARNRITQKRLLFRHRLGWGREGGDTHNAFSMHDTPKLKQSCRPVYAAIWPDRITIFKHIKMLCSERNKKYLAVFSSLSDRRLQNSQKVLSYKFFHVTLIWILQKNSKKSLVHRKCIKLFRERLLEIRTTVHATMSKGNLGIR